MTRISFRVKSIELKESALQNIDSNQLIKLNLTQNPNQKTEEYLLKNASYLHNINHEFIIDDPMNKVEKLTLSLGTASKKITLASIFNLDNNTKKVKPKNYSIDHYIGHSKENRDGYINCDYYETLHSCIGYRNIELKELKKGINNTYRIELLARGNVKVIGYINLDIYIWDIPMQSISQQNCSNMINEPILFVDPGCPQSNAEQVFF